MRKTAAERYVESAGDDLLTKMQLAPKLGVSARTINQYMKKGLLPYFKLGGLIRFKYSDVLSKINERRVN